MAWYKRQQEAADSPGSNPVESFPSPAIAPETGVEPAARSESRIGGALRIKGEIVGQEDFRVDGEVEGRVSLTGGRMTIGQAGRVSGPIEAREIVVQGTVRGNLRAARRIEIGPSGALEGDLAAERLHIAEGARVYGRIAAGPGPAPAPEKRSARPPRAEKPAPSSPDDAESSGQ